MFYIRLFDAKKNEWLLMLISECPKRPMILRLAALRAVSNL